MMAERLSDQANKPLGEILDAVLISHKRDIRDYAGGHLNESKLYKPPEQQTHKPWKSSAKDKPLTVRDSVPVAKSIPKTKPMHDAMLSFSVGTAGALPVPPTQPKKQYQRLRLNDKPSVRPNNTSGGRSTASFSENSYRDDGVFTEELYPPDAMLPTQKAIDRHRALTSQIVDEDIMAKPTTQSQIRQRNLQTVTHRFIPHHTSAVTKKEQYRQFIDFESNVLGKSDVMETQVLTGHKAVQHLEERLKSELRSLSYDGYGPNFHRLQVYSSVLDQLITETPTLSYVLKKVKEEYDDYIATLLDSQPPQHRTLHQQVQQLAESQTSQPDQLTALKRRVEKQELKAKKRLAENERLRSELQEELELASKVPEDRGYYQPTTFKADDSRPRDISEQINELQSSIMNKLDKLNNERKELRDQFVPLTVCTQLEQCIKESEIEAQKLANQNEYLEKEVTSMEDELNDALRDGEISDRDIKKIWNRIKPRDLPTSPSTIPCQGVRGSRAEQLPDSSRYEDTGAADGEEDLRWNWYIS